MQFHNYIAHHVHRHKEHLTAHISRHHRKYIFAAGAAIGMGIFKIIVILGTFIGFTFLTQGSRADNINNIEKDMAHDLELFDVMDGWCQQDAEQLTQSGNIYNISGFDLYVKCYYEIENAYHNAKNLNEKFREAKQLNEFFDEVDVILHKTTPYYDDPTSPQSIRDKQYHWLSAELKSIK